MQTTFNVTAWIVQTGLIFVGLLTAVPILRTLVGFLLLIAARIFTTPQSKLQKAGVRVLPRYVRTILGVTIGVSGLIATPAFATESKPNVDQPIENLQIDRISTFNPTFPDSAQTTYEVETKMKAHEVTSGESLWSIAAHRLVETGKNPTASEIDRTWRLIWKMNSDLIGSDPSIIKPGMLLELPENL